VIDPPQPEGTPADPSQALRLCEALGVSRSGFHAWLMRPPSKRAQADEETGARVRASFLASDRTYGARRVWRDVLAEGISCGLHKIERLMRAQALRARPRRRGLPKDEGDRLLAALSPNLLDRQFRARDFDGSFSDFCCSELLRLSC
jgi:putative transposase